MSTSATAADLGTESTYIVAEAWCTVLRVAEAAEHDDFFELGGDSILSILAVARARARGLYITPAQLFERQTVEALAAVARTESSIDAAQGPVLGRIALTPILRWFFDRGLPDPNHYNLSVLIQVSGQISREVLGQALDALIEHHEIGRAHV